MLERWELEVFGEMRVFDNYKDYKAFKQSYERAKKWSQSGKQPHYGSKEAANVPQPKNSADENISEDLIKEHRPYDQNKDNRVNAVKELVRGGWTNSLSKRDYKLFQMGLIEFRSERDMAVVLGVSPVRLHQLFVRLKERVAEEIERLAGPHIPEDFYPTGKEKRRIGHGPDA